MVQYHESIEQTKVNSFETVIQMLKDRHDLIIRLDEKVNLVLQKLDKEARQVKAEAL